MTNFSPCGQSQQDPDLSPGAAGTVCTPGRRAQSLSSTFRLANFGLPNSQGKTHSGWPSMPFSFPVQVKSSSPQAPTSPPSSKKFPARTRVEDWVWTADFAIPLVERQLGVRSLEGYGLVGHEPAAIAAGAVLHYVRTTQKNEALHVDSLRFEEHSTTLELDQVTVRNLELVEPLFAGQDSRATLFHALDECQTPMGKRLLRATILRPLMDAEMLEARYEAVGEAHLDLLKREGIRRAFSGILDLERLLARLSLDSAGPRDVRALAASLRRLPGLKTSLDEMSAVGWRKLSAALDTLEDVTERIEKTLVEEPPLTLADGRAIAAGVDAELDELAHHLDNWPSGDRGN